MILSELGFKKSTSYVFLSSFIILIIWGVVLFTYNYDIFFKKIFIYGLILSAILFFAWLIYIRYKKIQLILTIKHDSIEVYRVYGNTHALIAIPFELIKYYSVKYSNGNSCSIEFGMQDNHVHYFLLQDAHRFENQTDVQMAVKEIHKSINEYNRRLPISISKHKIFRKYGFFASKYGLLTIIIMAIIGLIMFLLILFKDAKGILAMPIYMGFLLMALGLRRKELNDTKGYIK